MIFHFKAQKNTGEIYEGEKEAQDKMSVYKLLQAEGSIAIYVKEKGEKKVFNIQNFLNRFSRVSVHEKIIFAGNLGAMLEAGLPLSRAFSVMERQSRNPKLIAIIKDISENLHRGDSLSQSLQKFPNVFSPLFISMVKSGEESGSLAQALINISDQLKNSYTLQKKIKGAMTYPIIIIGVMFIIGALMMIYVVPTLTKTFSDLNLTLPLSTRLIIAISNFLESHTLIALMLFIVLAVSVYYFFKTKFGKRIFDSSILKIPIIGTLVKETNSARTSRTLSSLLNAGVDVLVAIEIAIDVIQNVYYKEVLSNVKENIKKGKPISNVFYENEKLYPPFVGEMINIGEETGKLGAMLTSVAVFYENEVDQKTKDLSTIVEPFLMVFIGVAVGFFAISILSPMYSLVEAI